MNSGINRSTAVFLMLGATIGTVGHVHVLARGNGSGFDARPSSAPTVMLAPEGRRMARIVAEAAANTAAQQAHGMMLQIASGRDTPHSQTTIANAR